MQENERILEVKDIMKKYNLSRDTVYQLLNMKRCPLLTGSKKRKKYRVFEKDFDNWLHNLYK